MIFVHHLENSRSQRVLWLLEEPGLDYELKRYDRDKKTGLAPAALKKVHPLGKSPLVEVDGLVLAETGAIFDFLVEQFGEDRLHPPRGTEAFLRYRYWLYAAEGSYMPPLLISLLLSRMETAPMPFFIRPVAKRLTRGVREGYLDQTMKTHFDYAEGILDKTEWLAGREFSAADIIMSFPFEGLEARGDLGEHPKIADFLDRIRARPAHRRALERGGPFQLVQ